MPSIRSLHARKWTAIVAVGAVLSTTAVVAAAYNATNWSASGRVGVGTDVPAHRLSVIGGPAWTNKGWLGSIELANAGAIGWRTNSAAARVGLGHNNAGFAIFRTSANPGTATLSTANDLFIDNAGRVSLSAGAAAHRLSVGNGPAWTTSNWGGAIELLNGGAIGWRQNSDKVGFGMGHTNGGFHIFRTSSPLGTKTHDAIYDLTITDNGDVGIGTVSPAFKLHVKGSAWVDGGDLFVNGGSLYVGGTEMNVPDYVFEPGYPLRSLDSLRTYLADNKHLPNVPAEKEIRAGNLDLPAFQMRLLEKIEELTLYTLAQDELLKSDQRKIELLRQDNQIMMQRLAAVEARLANLPEKVTMVEDAP